MLIWRGKINFTIIILFFYGTCISQRIEDNRSNSELSSIVYRLVSNDSIAAARIILDNVSKRMGDKADNEFLLIYNYNYGIIFLSSGKYQESLTYFKKAHQISKLIPDNLYKGKLKAWTLRVYRETHLYKKLDSIYNIYVSDNKKKNSIYIYINHNDYIISLMDRNQYDQVISVGQKTLEELDRFDFTGEEGNIVYIVDKIIRNELKLHLAIALIEEKKEYKKSYMLLNELEKDSLFFVKRERDEYLGQVKQYKARYFYEFERNMDSVFHHQSLASKYKGIHIEKLKKRAFNANTFIYEIAKKEQDIEQLSIINEKNVQLNRNYYFINFLITTLLLLAFLFIIYIIMSNRQKNKINNELIKKNNELLAIDEERSQFFALISHDLRTPIYTIKGLIEIIERTNDKKQKEEYLKILKFSNNHLSGLVNNALEFTKFRLENVRLNKDAFLLDEMLEEMCNSFSYQLLKSNTKLHLDIQKDTETHVIGDRLRFSQIFINLISNAIKFTSNGNIWVQVKQLVSTEKTVKLRFLVSDDGIGIEKEMLTKIFDGFKSTSHVNKHKGGSGLGLYIVKKFIDDLYKSSIHVESEVGKGTSFSFDIEMEKTFSNLDKPICDLNYQNILKGYMILVVDDNKINLMITKKTVESVGAICETVDNGIEAEELVRQKKYDAVLMDVHMPEQDGLETAKNIRKFNKNIAIIALTAVDLESMISKIHQSGMNDVITKPYKCNDMFQKIVSYSLKKSA